MTDVAVRRNVEDCRALDWTTFVEVGPSDGPAAPGTTVAGQSGRSPAVSAGCLLPLPGHESRLIWPHSALLLDEDRH